MTKSTTPSYAVPIPNDDEKVADGASAMRTGFTETTTKIKDAILTATTGMATQTWVGTQFNEAFNWTNTAAKLNPFYNYVQGYIDNLRSRTTSLEAQAYADAIKFAERNTRFFACILELHGGIPPWSTHEFAIPATSAVMGVGSINSFPGWAWMQFGSADTLNYRIGYMCNLATTAHGPQGLRINIAAPIGGGWGDGWRRGLPQPPGTVMVNLPVPDAALRGMPSHVAVPMEQGFSLDAKTGDLMWDPGTITSYCHPQYPVPGWPEKTF